MKPEATARLEEFFEELRRDQCPFLECPVVEVNTRGSTGEVPLKIAVVRQDLTIVRDLLSAGADPNIQGEDDCTPLHYAALNESVEIVELLLAHGALTSIKDCRGSTPVDYAIPNTAIYDMLTGKSA